jgi:hypothetical protein
MGVVIAGAAIVGIIAYAGYQINKALQPVPVGDANGNTLPQ